MHELGIMTEAVDMAIETARANGAGRVLRLRLRVGALSGVVPEALRFAFDMACSDTMAQGAELDIDSVAASCWCPVCRAEFESDDLFGECPSCRNVSVELRRGRELEITSVEIR